MLLSVKLSIRKEKKISFAFCCCCCLWTIAIMHADFVTSSAEGPLETHFDPSSGYRTSCSKCEHFPEVSHKVTLSLGHNVWCKLHNFCTLKWTDDNKAACKISDILEIFKTGLSFLVVTLLRWSWSSAFLCLHGGPKFVLIHQEVSNWNYRHFPIVNLYQLKDAIFTESRHRSRVAWSNFSNFCKHQCEMIMMMYFKF